MISIANLELVKWSASYGGAKFHAVLCDPPYGLEFMGKEWDAPHKASSFPKAGNLGGFSDGNKPSFARQGDLSRLSEVYRVWGEAILSHLYPGALVLMFGGTRTWHRLAVGMEDAGFEIWDTMMWLHGQGFPKAQAIDKLIDAKNGDEREVVEQRRFKSGGTEYINRNNVTQGFRPNEYQKGENVIDVTAPGSEQSAPWQGYKTTALKPAWEPVLCFKKPLTGTYAEMAGQYGSGALNVDGGRIQGDPGAGVWGSSNADCKPTFNDSPELHDFRSRQHDLGRYPANVLLDPESAALLDEQSGELTSGDNPEQRHSDITRGIYGKFQGHDCFPARGADSGGASRFYYCAKASTAERNVGLDGAPIGVTHGATMRRIEAALEKSKRGNHHPTVKPIDLCRYLATLLLPPDSVKPRRLLVPFSGSGSEMIGAMLSGWDEILGVEQDTEHGYVQIAEARLDWWKWAKETSRLSDPNAILQRFGLVEEANPDQPKLFEQGSLGL